MIERRTRTQIDRAPTRQAGVVLIGPRQVGKTTLALDIADDRDAPYLDLESATDRARLADPRLFLEPLEPRLVVLDEIHKGFHHARADVAPERTYVVHAGADRYPVAEGVEAIGLEELVDELEATRADRHHDGQR